MINGLSAIMACSPYVTWFLRTRYSAETGVPGVEDGDRGHGFHDDDGPRTDTGIMAAVDLYGPNIALSVDGPLWL